MTDPQQVGQWHRIPARRRLIETQAEGPVIGKGVRLPVATATGNSVVGGQSLFIKKPAAQRDTLDRQGIVIRRIDAIAKIGGIW